MLKGLFRRWWGNAVRHRSSVIPFDNVDKLPGVELEHADTFHVSHFAELFVAHYSAVLHGRPMDKHGGMYIIFPLSLNNFAILVHVVERMLEEALAESPLRITLLTMQA
ncbi:hypothetical protein FIBSPDRAFT_959995 [Athelia psychrophila]|uniref:Uncharacterized protein n=1 Tax=Athelia psychrophila TaxID=1759441 RepID=A0A166CVR4_9AGAM|nr:hypothetical protein FIBSPDRAFT_959995 [Fibularhizoctonia sp. CBS 109695]